MNNQKLCVALLLLAGVMSCSEPENPDAVRPAEKLLLTTPKDRTQLKANGRDSLYLTARLPDAAGAIDVTFTTTGGTFVYSGAQTDKQYADSTDGTYRYATTLLRADTLPRAVYVTAEIANARYRLSLTFTK